MSEEKEKKMQVCWPSETPEDRAMLMKIIDNYLPRYAGTETQEVGA